MILLQPAKFRYSQAIHGRVMTSYRFFKMAAMKSQIYFRVQVQWRHLFKKVDNYLHTKFRWYISHSMAEIKLLRLSENTRPPY